MKMRNALILGLLVFFPVLQVHGGSFTVDGTDAIYLAGRTDITIPPLGTNPSTFLARHGFVAADFLLETFPDFKIVTAGDVLNFLATGCVNYFNGIGCSGPGTGFGPDGGDPNGSILNSFGGISSYSGPEGALVGLFLDANIPNGVAPSGLNFTGGGLGMDFLELSPGLGQVFFIGDGQTSGNVVQAFMAPEGATRLFLGIPDGFSFDDKPGAYEDNDGFFLVAAPEFSGMLYGIPNFGWIFSLGGGLVGLVGIRRKQYRG